MRVAANAVAVLALGLCWCASASAQAPFQPGVDLFETLPGTSLDFGGGLPPIPPDFFGPGSEPFTGPIQLGGNPAPSNPDSHDTVIQRNGPAGVPNPGDTITIPIEMVELSLRSVQPIAVTFNNGNPDSFFDVFVSISPTPSTSSANVQRTDIICGDIFYNPQITLNVTFVPLGPGDAATLPVGPLFLTPLTPCKWGQLPFAGVRLNPTPNLFPRTEFVLSSPGGGFVHHLRPARHVDCDGDGVADIDQIADNPMLDLNRDGVIDRCEINAGVTQISFPLLPPDIGFVERYSSSGQLAVEYIPSFFDIFWLHATNGPLPLVLNAPMLDVNSQGDPHICHLPIALPTLPGDPLPQLPVFIHPTDAPILGPDLPVLPPVVLPVLEHVLSPGLEDGPFIAAFTHGFSEGLLTPVVPGPTWMSVSRRNMEGVNEAKNHCAPGAVARSLDWLQNILCLQVPANNDQAQEMYEKLRNMQHLMTTEANGTSRTKYVPGINQFLSDKMMQDCLTVMRVIDNDPCRMFEDLQKGCDVVGNISWYNADGSRNGGHAVTVSAAIKCDEEVSIEFNDDAHGSDKQADNKADSGDTKKAKIMNDAANPGRKRLVGYGRNSWDGYIKVCPTRKCQIDAVNKWINGAPADGVEGIESLVNRLLGGVTPTEADKKNIKRWAENAYDAACFLVKNMEGCDDPALDDAKTAAQALKDAMGIVVVRCIIYSFDCNLAELGILPGLIGPAHDALRDQVRAGVDCDGNGVDDLIDIARGDLADADGNCIPDICETAPCPGDYNGDGVVDLADLIAFNTDWQPNVGLIGPPGSPGDYNGDGMVDLADLVGFNTDWQPNIGTTCP